jgi:hypothetical protein
VDVDRRHPENFLAAAARDYEFREGVGREMSVTQRVRVVQISSDSPSFDNRSINEDAETDDVEDDVEDSVPQVKISILMCAYNEHRTIGRAVREVLAADYPCEVELIVVDDGSKDSTARIVAKIADPRVILHKHSHNMGKGAALRTAASLATGTHLLPFDADLEYSPKDIPRLIEPLLTGRFEVVYGTRLFGYNTVYQSFRYAVGNRILTTLTNVMFDSYLSDMHTCLKLMPLSLFNSVSLSENRFGLDTEVTATLLRLGYRPFEVPVSYYSRSHAQGKKINWRDAVACLRILFKVRFKKKSKLMLSTAEQTEPKGLLFPSTLTQPDPDAVFTALDTFDSTDLLSNDVMPSSKVSTSPWARRLQESGGAGMAHYPRSSPRRVPTEDRRQGAHSRATRRTLIAAEHRCVIKVTYVHLSEHLPRPSGFATIKDSIVPKGILARHRVRASRRWGRRRWGHL